VNAKRSRAVPAGTVGGRMATTRKPSLSSISDAASAASASPMTTGTMALCASGRLSARVKSLALRNGSPVKTRSRSIRSSAALAAATGLLVIVFNSGYAAPWESFTIFALMFTGTALYRAEQGQYPWPRAIAVAVATIGMGIAAPLIGALVASTGELPVDAVADVVADRDAMLRGVAHHSVVEFAAPATGPAGTTQTDGTAPTTAAAHAAR